MKALAISGLVMVLSFPLSAGALFAISYIAYRKIYKADGRTKFAQRQFYLYSFFLLLLFSIVLFIAIRLGILDKIGLRLPSDLFRISMIGAGILVGIALYCIELHLSRFFGRISNSIWPSSKAERTSGRNLSNSYFPRFYILVLLSIGISFCEEFIWRGFLITLLRSNLSLSLWVSIMLSSIFFGLNHYYFGLRAIISKTLDGAIWGLLFVSTRNVIIPFISHAALDIWVWKEQRCGSQ